jgi:hypothetical protein
LALYAHTPLHLAYEATLSQCTEFFDSKTFSDWQKGRENEGKAQMAVLDRIDNVIRGESVIIKAISRRPSL